MGGWILLLWQKKRHVKGNASKEDIILALQVCLVVLRRWHFITPAKRLCLIQRLQANNIILRILQMGYKNRFFPIPIKLLLLISLSVHVPYYVFRTVIASTASVHILILKLWQ